MVVVGSSVEMTELGRLVPRRRVNGSFLGFGGEGGLSSSSSSSSSSSGSGFLDVVCEAVENASAETAGKGSASLKLSSWLSVDFLGSQALLPKAPPQKLDFSLRSSFSSISGN